jgi:putative transposase
MRHRHLSPRAQLRQPGWDNWLADALGLTDYSQGATRPLLARCLLVAAALRVAVSAVARWVAGLGRETVRKGITAALPEGARALEGRLGAAFRHVLPRHLRHTPVPVAIDIHRRPYYGDRTQTTGTTGARRAAGTNRFWSYATACVLVPGCRHTLALSAVGPSDKLADVVERLLTQVNWAGVAVRYVLLDRAFYAVGVVRALVRRNLRFVIPVVRRGQQALTLFRRGIRGWFDHTLRGHRRADGAAVVRVAVVPSADGRRRPQVFACSDDGFGPVARVALVYGRRFGIESSYRQLGECLAQTTSRECVYRLLLVGVSLLIRARWVGLADRPLGAIRWELIVTFTITDPRTRELTQTVRPQQHSPA